MVQSPLPKSYKALHKSVPEKKNKKKHRAECKNRLKMKASQPAKDKNLSKLKLSIFKLRILMPISYTK